MADQTIRQQILPDKRKTASDQNSGCFDLAVIGGGINGSAVAMEAALRGLTVLLIDKQDLGAGTTAYSTRLIHGGLRYLENLEIGLVRESLRERQRLLRNAPHLVRPLRLGIPVYQKPNSGQVPKPKRRSTVWILAGMIGYSVLSLGADWLSADKNMSGFEYYGRKDFLKRFPGLDAEGLTGGFIYYDAQVNFPERLCIEYAVAANETGNAVIKTHTRLDSMMHQAENGHYEATGITMTDLISGMQYAAKAKVIVNAAGPWVDQVAQLSKDINPLKPTLKRIGGTQGTHIVVERFAAGPEYALYAEASNGRPFFIIPWQKTFYLIGTTDNRYEGNLDKVVASEKDIDFLLQETNRLLPEATLSRAQVLYSYSGVRPLPNDDGKPEGQITRKHVIADHAQDSEHPLRNFISLIGGKLTTARNFAEETVDYILKHYLSEQVAPMPLITPSTSKKTPLPGGKGIMEIHSYKQAHIESAAREYTISAAVVDHLINLYGVRFRNVLELTRQAPELKKPLISDGFSIKAQVVYALEQEFAVTLIDVMRRLGENLNASVGLDVLEPVAEMTAQVSHWSGERLQKEMNEYRAWVNTFNLVHQQ